MIRSRYQKTRTLHSGAVQLSPYHWRIARSRFYAKQEGLCAECGEFTSFEYFELDHITKRSLGRDDRDSNLRGLCTDCHRSKHEALDSWRTAKIV